METNAILGFQDPIDSWTHLLGALAVILLLFKLFYKKDGIGRRYPFSIITYGFVCIFLLSMSGVYHLLPRETTARYVLRILDHSGIFLMIAGTLTAVHAILFSGIMKWGFIIAAATIAVTGITLGAIFFSNIETYMTHSVFLVFGWLGVVSIRGILKLDVTLSIKYLVYGGLSYTLGAVIDWLEIPILIPGYFGAHQIFHLAVLLGVAFHWVFLLESIRAVEGKV